MTFEIRIVRLFARNAQNSNSTVTFKIRTQPSHSKFESDICSPVQNPISRAGADAVPSYHALQMALVNDEDYVEELFSITAHLLKLALEDPGIPNPREALTTFGGKVVDCEIDDDNMSEILRIFIAARNGKEDNMAAWLREKPLIALNATKKAAILGFLCDELLCSKNVNA